MGAGASRRAGAAFTRLLAAHGADAFAVRAGLAVLALLVQRLLADDALAHVGAEAALPHLLEKGRSAGAERGAVGGHAGGGGGWRAAEAVGEARREGFVLPNLAAAVLAAGYGGVA